MFLAILLGLMPLGILALLAATQAMRTAEADRRALFNIGEREIAQQISGDLDANAQALAIMIRDPQTGETQTDWLKRLCERSTAWRATKAIEFDLYILGATSGFDRCSMGMSGHSRDVLPGNRTQPFLSEERDALIQPISLPDPAYQAVILYPRSLLGTLSQTSTKLPPFDLAMTDGQAELVLLESGERNLLPGTAITLKKPVGQSGLMLELTARRADFDRAQLISLATPLLMWLLAAALSWVMLNWLILRPMQALQRNVSDYRPGNLLEIVPHRVTDEIVDLQDSFSRMAERVAEDKRALDAAIIHQQTLTREVHHRVKNNLQIVASLISLYSRDARDPEAKQAFRTIQRRVDALAVVHRNHFAALEQGAGISLRPLFAELQSALGQGDLPDGADGSISLDIAAVRVSQDVALPVAFLVTELVEIARAGPPPHAVTIAVTVRGTSDNSARLTVICDGFASDQTEVALTEGNQGRVLTGLSRQLRQPLNHTRGSDRFDIIIPTIADQA